VAAQPKTTAKVFNAPNCNVTFEDNRGFQSESGWNNDLALQALAGFEPLAGDAIETFTTEIFSTALNQASKLPN
jgi:hypothetical protein